MHDRIEGRRIHCYECRATAQVARARRDGKPDPFPVYENTINSHRTDVLSDLQTRLHQTFGHHTSVVHQGRPAVFVTPGHDRRPLAVKSYYICDQQEQDRLIALVRDLFDQPPFYQVKVEMWEAEVWTTWYSAERGGGGGVRGEESLLRDVDLNCG